MPNLAERSCTHRTGPALTPAEAAALLAEVPGWSIGTDAKTVEREFRFTDYYETIAFVNAIAWVIHAQDHHPDLEVGYNRCRVRFSTHSVNGLSENDFICAARISALLPP